MVRYKLINDSENRHSVQHEEGIKLLSDMLCERYGIIISENDIVYASHGKPFLRNRPDIHFNISHTAGLCCCIVTRGIRCGIDCERIRLPRDKVAERIMSAEELYVYKSLTEVKKSEYFFLIWTLKEAYGKYTGNGISDLKKVSFSFDYKSLQCSVEGLFFRVYRLNDYIISICSECDNDSELKCDFGSRVF